VAAKFANQFTVGLQFGARRLLEIISENGSKLWFVVFGALVAFIQFSFKSGVVFSAEAVRRFKRYSSVFNALKPVAEAEF
jgi:hypothetical protein